MAREPAVEANGLSNRGRPDADRREAEWPAGMLSFRPLKTLRERRILVRPPQRNPVEIHGMKAIAMRPSSRTPKYSQMRFKPASDGT